MPKFYRNDRYKLEFWPRRNKGNGILNFDSNTKLIKENEE